ncbi:class I SAM-dependent methyltransferase [Candidatus Saccharibacteria bacterium]|nr:class I SAM-dependent methyltransferase [Candidatus Saccharibacteria bacterium]
MTDWDTFNKNTKDNPPRELYQEAVELIAPHSLCLDVAAGALVDTKDMLARGHRVVAIDSNPSLLNLAEQVGSPSLDPIISTMEDYEYGVERFDYINAMFALPFIAPEAFGATFERIVQSLKQGGVFAFHLFGHEDDWYDNPMMTFHTQAEVEKLVEDLETVKLKEIKDSMAQGDGSLKHWHIFQLIVRK